MENASTIIKKIVREAEKTSRPAITEVDLKAGEYTENGDGEGGVYTGQYIYQGDVRIERSDTLPKGAVIVHGASPQIVEGNGPGSRHVISARTFKDCVIYKRKDADPIEGSIIWAPKGFDLEHPEHGDIRFKGAGYYPTFGQVQHAEVLKRLKD